MEPPEGYVALPCLACGRIYQTLRAAPAPFCSVACADAAHRRVMALVRAHLATGAWLDVLLNHCGGDGADCCEHVGLLEQRFLPDQVPTATGGGGRMTVFTDRRAYRECLAYVDKAAALGASLQAELTAQQWERVAEWRTANVLGVLALAVAYVQHEREREDPPA
jgi:hypothetical protein